MSQTDYDNDFIMWTIDRTPDYSILNQYYSRRLDTILDTMEELNDEDYINPIYTSNNDDDEYNFNYMYNYDTIRNNMFLQNFTQVSNLIISGNSIFDEEDDFIPFILPENISEPDNPSINFTGNEFQLSQEDLKCCICMEEQDLHQMCQLNCQHSFCIICIDKHLERNSICPLCRKHISHITTQSIETRQRIHH